MSVKKDTSCHLQTEQSRQISRWIDRVAGDECIKGGGCVTAGKQSSTKPLSLLAYTKQANTRGESGDAHSFSEVIFNPVNSRTMPYWSP